MQDRLCFSGLQIHAAEQVGKARVRAQRITATSRTLLWLASRWGCRGRHFSRGRRNPGKKFWLSWYRRTAQKHVPVRGAPAHRLADFLLRLNDQEFFEIRWQPQRPVSRRDTLLRVCKRDTGKK